MRFVCSDVTYLVAFEEVDQIGLLVMAGDDGMCAGEQQVMV